MSHFRRALAVLVLTVTTALATLGVAGVTSAAVASPSSSQLPDPSIRCC